jgi:CHAD domain-containing protein
MELDYVKLKEIKPALSGYIMYSRSLLKQLPIPDEKSVHDIRVLMKKSRAVLRLLGTQIDDDTLQRENLGFRQVGRMLCQWRETSVLRKTIKDLRKRNPDIFSRLEDNEKINLLLTKPDQDPEISEECRSNVSEVDEMLKKAGYRIRFQSMNNLNPQLMLKELERTYINVVDNYLTCKNKPIPADLHKFRKRTKDFLYQLYFFRPLNPSVVKELEKKLDSLTQNLGKYNDLAQVEKILGYKYRVSQNPPALDELMIIIREEQDRYLAKVWPVAFKIFCPGQKLLNILGFRLLII